MQKKVMVAMSGGVDSSVSAIILKNLGYKIKAKIINKIDPIWTPVEAYFWNLFASYNLAVCCAFAAAWSLCNLKYSSSEEKSLFGFKNELQKLADNPPDEKELMGAKENISGRLKYFTQNNSQICSLKGYNYIMGLGLNYSELFLDDIFKTSKEDVSDMAKKLLSMPFVSAIIAPEQYKNSFKL